MASTLFARAVATGVLLALPHVAAAQQPARGALQDPTHETTTPDVPGLNATASLCPVSSDATYSTLANPIKVGGGAAYAGAREVRYLSALRGPAGQGLHFKRLGSSQTADGTIVDSYLVEYVGIERPLTLYLDAYHWAAPQAPGGLLCGTAMNLDPPGPDPFETSAHIRTMAIALGDQNVQPLSLDPDGSQTHGVMFDQVRLVAFAARAAAANGMTLDPRSLPAPLLQARLIVVAFPLVCEGRSIAPESITIADARGNSPPKYAADDTAATQVPGFTMPAGSIVAAYRTNSIVNGAKAVVQYTDSCAGTKTLELPTRSENARLIKGGPGITPAGVTLPAAGATVRVQVLLDRDGVPQFPAYAGGPAELSDAAIAAAKEWRFEPPKINGSIVLQPVTVGIVFRN